MSTTKSPTELSGLFGEELTVRKLKHRIVIKNRPRLKPGPPSEKQEAVVQRFLEGAQYAKRELANPESRAMYEAGITPQKSSAHMVAMTDYLTPPKVHEIDAENYLGSIGDTIMVRATDDFMVTGVKIAILNSEGTVLEKGEAEPDALLNYWKYTAKVANPELTGTRIQVTAFDRPGHKGKKEVTL